MKGDQRGTLDTFTSSERHSYMDPYSDLMPCSRQLDHVTTDQPRNLMTATDHPSMPIRAPRPPSSSPPRGPRVIQSIINSNTGALSFPVTSMMGGSSTIPVVHDYRPYHTTSSPAAFIAPVRDGIRKQTCLLPVVCKSCQGGGRKEGAFVSEWILLCLPGCYRDCDCG